MSIELQNKPLPLRAFYTSGKNGKTGLTVTVTVYDPEGAAIVTDAAATEIGLGLYGYTLAADKTALAGIYLAIFHTDDATVNQQDLPCDWEVGTVWSQYIARLGQLPPDEPLVVMPTPPVDTNQCLVYLYSESITGTMEVGKSITFTLSSWPTLQDGYGLTTKSVTFTTNDSGYLSGILERTDTMTPAGRIYYVNSADFGLVNKILTLTEDTMTSNTYNLAGLFA